MKSSYEPGMKITFEPNSKRVVVAFRGRITVLPDEVADETQAINAGESHCRRLGWNPRDWQNPAKKSFRCPF